MNAVLLVVTGLALLIAAVASLVAWRVLREERRRSDARVAALSREIYGDDGVDVWVTPSASTVRYGLMAIGAVVVVAVAAFTLQLWGRPFRVTGATGVKGPSDSLHGPARKPLEAPLELLALEHERDGGRLVVRGLLRNPGNGLERDGLMAVVFGYDRDGDLLASGRAAVLAAKLTPGETTPFVVYLTGADTLDRFRVSFRTGTRVEPHVDRRSRGDVAKEVDP
jgi:hypothetical protein